MARGSRIPLPPTTSSRVVGITRTNHTNTMLHMQLNVAVVVWHPSQAS